MFGLGKKDSRTDHLSVQVHVISSKPAYELATRLWNENARTVHTDEQTRKEFLHFGYNNPKCVAWLQRDQGRSDPLELIVRWEEDKTHEVFVISADGAAAGDATRLTQVLQSMLITPSIVLSVNK